MSVPECKTHHHRPVRQGVRAETASTDGGGYEGKHGKDVPGLRNITKLGIAIEVPRSYHDGIGVVVNNLVNGGG